jgi:hypothetical protein
MIKVVKVYSINLLADNTYCHTSMGNAALESAAATSDSNEDNNPQLIIKVYKVHNIHLSVANKPTLAIHIYYGDNPFQLLHHTTSYSIDVDHSSITFNEEIECDILYAIQKKIMFIDFELVDHHNVEIGSARTKNLFQLEPLEEATLMLPLRSTVHTGATLQISIMLKQQDPQITY